MARSRQSILLAAVLLAACGGRADLDAATPDADLDGARLDAGRDAGPPVDWGLDMPDAAPPPGAWTPVPTAISGCNVELADQPSALGPISFEPCTSGAAGCRQLVADAFYTTEAHDDAHGYFVVEDALDAHSVRQMLLRDDGAVLFAAQGAQGYDRMLPAPCSMGTFARPDTYFVFLQPPGDFYSGMTAHPSASFRRRPGVMFRARASFLSADGAMVFDSTYCPWAAGSCASVSVGGVGVALSGTDFFTSDASGIAVRTLPSGLGSLLLTSTVPGDAYDQLGTDGLSLAWWVGHAISPGMYDHVALYTAPYSTDPAAVALTATMLDGSPPPTASPAQQLLVGGGHVAAITAARDVTVWELTTGARHTVTVPVGATVGPLVYAGPTEVAFVVANLTPRPAINLVRYDALP